MKINVQQLFKKIAEHIGDNFYFKAVTAVYLFDFLDKIRQENFPADWFKQLEGNINQLLTFFDFQKKSFDIKNPDFSVWKDKESEEVFAQKTGEVYYQLWKDFSKKEYFKQATKNLKERFKKNNISLKNIYNALDDGCGNGRYTLALKSLGLKKITGVDISQNSIELAKKMSPFPKNEVRFVQGSVLNLPFKDDSFDFVFCNGVLHHTESTEKGLSEIFRVSKPGGICWLYLYGGKGSLFWDIVDFCRELLSNVPQSYTQTVMKTLGYPAGRIFHRSDFFYVPVNRRYLESEVETMLKKTGFVNFRRLKRGVMTDWDEIIHNNPSIDPYIYGEGEMRFLITK